MRLSSVVQAAHSCQPPREHTPAFVHAAACAIHWQPESPHSLSALLVSRATARRGPSVARCWLLKTARRAILAISPSRCRRASSRLHPPASTQTSAGQLPARVHHGARPARAPPPPPRPCRPGRPPASLRASHGARGQLPVALSLVRGWRPVTAPGPASPPQLSGASPMATRRAPALLSVPLDSDDLQRLTISNDFPW